VAASLAVWWCGSAPAFAQSFDAYYDFSFFGFNGVRASGVFEFYLDSIDPANSYLIGISGSVSGFRDRVDDGSIKSLLAPVPVTDDKIRFRLWDGTLETLILTPEAPIAELKATHRGNRRNAEYSYGPLYTASANGPAPVPGAGLLSYLVLGLAGVFITRERLWRATRVAVGMAALTLPPRGIKRSPRSQRRGDAVLVSSSCSQRRSDRV
jgi:hypothetical protein